MDKETLQWFIWSIIFLFIFILACFYGHYALRESSCDRWENEISIRRGFLGDHDVVVGKIHCWQVKGDNFFEYTKNVWTGENEYQIY